MKKSKKVISMRKQERADKKKMEQVAIATMPNEQPPAPEGKKGKWIALPPIAKGHQYYQLHVDEDFEQKLIEPQPKEGELFFAEDQHLYCGADSSESADQIFADMLKALVVDNAKVHERKKERSRIIKPGIGSLYLPKGTRP